MGIEEASQMLKELSGFFSSQRRNVVKAITLPILSKISPPIGFVLENSGIARGGAMLIPSGTVSVNCSCSALATVGVPFISTRASILIFAHGKLDSHRVTRNVEIAALQSQSKLSVWRFRIGSFIKSSNDLTPTIKQLCGVVAAFNL